ncbi:MAG: hypothetical protein DRP85_04175 [Candidatus Makaraimicrobium thalassicum]|nr:MAG: hypothetical protein DRP85_04175 [Candidatus Omnitrophota bacterium]
MPAEHKEQIKVTILFDDKQTRDAFRRTYKALNRDLPRAAEKFGLALKRTAVKTGAAFKQMASTQLIGAFRQTSYMLIRLTTRLTSRILYSFQRMFFMLRLAVAGFVAYFTKQWLEMGKAVERWRVSLATAFKKTGGGFAWGAAEKWMDWARKIAMTIPATIAEVTETVKYLGIVHMNIKKWMPIIADMHAMFLGMGRTLEDAAKAVMMARGGRFRRLLYYGVKREDIAAYARETGIGEIFTGGVYGAIADRAKFDRALYGYLRKTFGGAAQEMMRSVVGLVSNIKDVFLNMLIEVNKASGSAYDLLRARLDDILQRLHEWRMSEGYTRAKARIQAVGKYVVGTGYEYLMRGTRWFTSEYEKQLGGRETPKAYLEAFAATSVKGMGKIIEAFLSQLDTAITGGKFDSIIAKIIDIFVASLKKAMPHISKILGELASIMGPVAGRFYMEMMQSVAKGIWRFVAESIKTPSRWGGLLALLSIFAIRAGFGQLLVGLLKGGKARGGPIDPRHTGPERLILAEAGEYVVNKRAAAKWRPLLDAINSYQSGGEVSVKGLTLWRDPITGRFVKPYTPGAVPELGIRAGNRFIPGSTFPSSEFPLTPGEVTTGPTHLGWKSFTGRPMTTMEWLKDLKFQLAEKSSSWGRYATRAWNWMRTRAWNWLRGSKVGRWAGTWAEGIRAGWPLVSKITTALAFLPEFFAAGEQAAEQAGLAGPEALEQRIWRNYRLSQMGLGEWMGPNWWEAWNRNLSPYAWAEYGTAKLFPPSQAQLVQTFTGLQPGDKNYARFMQQYPKTVRRMEEERLKRQAEKDLDALVGATAIKQARLAAAAEQSGFTLPAPITAEEAAALATQAGWKPGTEMYKRFVSAYTEPESLLADTVEPAKTSEGPPEGFDAILWDAGYRPQETMTSEEAGAVSSGTAASKRCPSLGSFETGNTPIWSPV